MNTAALRIKLHAAIATAEREREKAERGHKPATRDKEYGKVLAWLDEEEQGE